ncbi:lectin like domain-containing protein [Leptothrix ochracea]|uniref:lectin like domain-containing protein n=1 Tax=Leptothrix ochracea TaxID=735331 RepID=UPI0034E1DF9C
MLNRQNIHNSTMHGHGPSILAATVALLVASLAPAMAEPPSGKAGHDGEFTRRMGPGGVDRQPQQIDDGKGHVRGVGHRPSPVDRSHMRGQVPQSLPKIHNQVGAGTGTSTAPTAAPTSTFTAVGLPTSYVPPSAFDLRSTGQLSPVRDQGACGDCWAFATFGAMESETIAAGDPSFILSPNHLNVGHGFAYPACGGGNATLSMAYLTRWGDSSGHTAGPVLEADDPYTATAATSVAGLVPRYHAQEVLVLPDKAAGATSADNINWKYALQQYGGLYVAFNIDTTSLDTLTGKPKFWNNANAAYYYFGGTGTNHAVTLVGWDDNYPASSFATQPPGNGAYILKNQWGSNWGQSGYFYVSYYDTSLQEAVAMLAPEPVSNYTHQFMIDPHGNIGSWGYGSSTGWIGNIFTAGAAEPNLQAVSFFTNGVDSAYEVRVYTNVTTTPSTGTLQSAATVTGTIAYAGYHTVRLPSPVSLAPGQQFSVVVKLNTPGTTFPIPTESNVPGYTGVVTSVAGRSFMGSNGSSWTDLNAYGENANIRALTGLSLSALPTAQQGQAYAQALSVTDGTGPYTYAVTRGSLPAGLSLAADGTLSGTPTSSGSASFTISATDSTAANQGGPFTGARSYSLSITPSPASQTQSINFDPAPNLSVGATATIGATATSGLPVSLSAAPTSTCALSGTQLTGVSPGTCTITASQPGDAVYVAAPPATQAIVVGSSTGTTPQAISLSTTQALMVGGTSALSAAATSGLSVRLTNITPATCALNGNTLSGLAAGTCTLNADQGGDTVYSAAPTATLNVPVQKLNQSVSFSSVPANLLVGASATLVASASSNLGVSYSTLSPTVCTVSAATVKAVAAGTCTVSADQVGNASINPAPQASASFPVTVPMSNQTITFGTLPTLTANTSGTLSATATSGLTVSFGSQTPATCSVNGNTVAGVAAGTCTVVASQIGNTSWNPATNVSKNITVGAAVLKAQTLTVTAPTTLTLGTTGTITATSTSGLPVTITATTPTICTVSGSTITPVIAGACTLSSTQAGDQTWKAATAVTSKITVSAPVLKAQTLTVTAPTTLTLGTTGTVTATSTSGLTVALASTTPTICTLVGSTLTPVAAGSCAITASQAGDTTWKAATAVTKKITVSAPVLKAQTITFAPATTLTRPATLALTATSTSGLAVTIASTTPTICTVSVSGTTTTLSGVVAGTCKVTASQAGDTVWKAATAVSKSITVK